MLLMHFVLISGRPEASPGIAQETFLEATLSIRLRRIVLAIGQVLIVVVFFMEGHDCFIIQSPRTSSEFPRDQPGVESES